MHQELLLRNPQPEGFDNWPYNVLQYHLAGGSRLQAGMAGGQPLTYLERGLFAAVPTPGEDGYLQ